MEASGFLVSKAAAVCGFVYQRLLIGTLEVVERK